jgi:acyl carrier protein
MNRISILSVIAKHLANAVDGLDASTIDGTRSMKDYGANSLDIVEVVSASMRELKVKVPRSELNKLKDINGLADLLSTTAQGTAQSAPRAATPVPQ